MKKGILLLTFPLLLIQSALADDFRGYDWGTRAEDIIAKEGEPERLDEDMAALVYSDLIAGVKMEVHYRFEDGRLQTGAYYSKTDFVSPKQAMKEFHRFEEILAQKYGGEVELKEMWFRKEFQNADDKYALGLMAGDLVLITSRIFERTEVRHQLSGAGQPDHYYEHRIFYKAQIDVTPQVVSEEDLGKL